MKYWTHFTHNPCLYITHWFVSGESFNIQESYSTNSSMISDHSSGIWGHQHPRLNIFQKTHFCIHNVKLFDHHLVPFLSNNPGDFFLHFKANSVTQSLILTHVCSSFKLTSIFLLHTQDKSSADTTVTVQSQTSFELDSKQHFHVTNLPNMNTDILSSIRCCSECGMFWLYKNVI